MYLDDFDVCPSDNTKAVCQLCHNEVSRGGKPAKTFSPTNLKTHLQRTHLKEYKEYTEKKKQEVTERNFRHSPLIFLNKQVQTIPAGDGT